MALEYSLELVTDLEPLQVVDLLAESFGLARREQDCLGGRAIWISVTRTPGSWRSVIEEGLHFVPDVSIGFRLTTRDDDYLEARRLMVRCTSLLLERAGRDGVLLFNGETILLLRVNGGLVLNADWRWEEADVDEAIALPHERRPLPSPLL